MMNPIRPFAKKLILAYGVAVLTVLIYLLIKALFPTTKEIELKSFNKPATISKKPTQNETEKTEMSNEQNSKNSFILLPRE